MPLTCDMLPICWYVKSFETERQSSDEEYSPWGRRGRGRRVQTSDDLGIEDIARVESLMSQQIAYEHVSVLSEIDKYSIVCNVTAVSCRATVIIIIIFFLLQFSSSCYFYEQIQRLDLHQARTILEQSLSRDPSLIFDVLSQLVPEAPPPVPPVHLQPSWCICQRCRGMPTLLEQKCCNQQPQMCISTLPHIGLHFAGGNVAPRQEDVERAACCSWPPTSRRRQSTVSSCSIQTVCCLAVWCSRCWSQGCYTKLPCVENPQQFSRSTWTI